MSTPSDSPRKRGRDVQLPASPARIDAELQDEFQFHIEERIEQFVAEGMTRAQAEQEVAQRFGNYEAHRSLTRAIDQDTLLQRRRSDLFRTVGREMVQATRALRRSPGFSFIAFITLALGIGATTAMFTVLDAVVLRPLPYREPDALVSILHPANVPGSGERKWGLSAGGYFHFRAANKSFESIGIYRNNGTTVTNGGAAEMTQRALVTSSIFSVLKAKPAMGRLLSDADDQPGAARVAVLSHEFHQRRFGGDTGIVGKMLETSGGPMEIVGVTEPGLTLPMPGPFASSANLAGFGVDFWQALQENPAGPFQNSHPYVGLGRLKPGVTGEQAQRDIEALFKTFPDVIPTAYSTKFIANYNFRVEVAALREAVLGPTIPRALWMLLAAVTMVLLIAAANVSNLFLVRMEARRRESAIRTALGADRLQMFVHFLTESILLCTAAAAAGVALAWVGLRALLLIAPTNIPRLASVSMTPRAAGVALAIGLLVGLVLGLVPLLRRELDLMALRDSSRGLSASPRQRAARSALVVGQIAFALVLLAAAGLMLRSFERLRHVRPGFDAANTLAFDLSLPYAEFKTHSAAIAFHRELQRRIGEIPGVVAVGATSSIPLEGFGTGCSVVFRHKDPYPSGTQTPCVSISLSTPGVFDALRIPVQGRTPEWRDVDSRSQAAVITRALAERLWPGQDPIGRGMNSNGSSYEFAYTIVGVIPELKGEALDQPPMEAVFFPVTSLSGDDRGGNLNDLSYLVRTNGADPLVLVPGIRAIISEMNPRVPFVDARSMTSVLERSMARTSFIMIMLGVSAAVALLLSVVGIYGVVSYVVAQRRSEIGIRMALGASVSQVMRMVVTQSARMAVLGVALGLVGALAATKTLRTLLFEVSPGDSLVLATVALGLLAIVVAASLGPARRAARIDPAETMRGA